MTLRRPLQTPDNTWLENHPRKQWVSNHFEIEEILKKLRVKDEGAPRYRYLTALELNQLAETDKKAIEKLIKDPAHAEDCLDCRHELQTLLEGITNSWVTEGTHVYMKDLSSFKKHVNEIHKLRKDANEIEKLRLEAEANTGILAFITNFPENHSYIWAFIKYVVIPCAIAAAIVFSGGFAALAGAVLSEAAAFFITAAAISIVGNIFLEAAKGIYSYFQEPPSEIKARQDLIAAQKSVIAQLATEKNAAALALLQKQQPQKTKTGANNAGEEEKKKEPELTAAEIAEKEKAAALAKQPSTGATMTDTSSKSASTSDLSKLAPSSPTKQQDSNKAAAPGDASTTSKAKTRSPAMQKRLDEIAQRERDMTEQLQAVQRKRTETAAKQQQTTSTSPSSRPLSPQPANANTKAAASTTSSTGEEKHSDKPHMQGHRILMDNRRAAILKLIEQQKAAKVQQSAAATSASTKQPTDEEIAATYGIGMGSLKKFQAKLLAWNAKDKDTRAQLWAKAKALDKPRTSTSTSTSVLLNTPGNTPPHSPKKLKQPVSSNAAGGVDTKQIALQIHLSDTSDGSTKAVLVIKPASMTATSSDSTPAPVRQPTQQVAANTNVVQLGGSGNGADTDAEKTKEQQFKM